LKLKPSLIAECAVAIALAAVLSMFKIKLPHLIYGGSVSLHMLPLILVGLRHGIRAGALTGGAYGFVNFVMTPYFVHPIQIALDYPVAFAALGTAGLASARETRSLWGAAGAVLAAGSLRLFVHVLSGVVYFADLAPAGTPAWEYSLVYNSSYMIPETLISCLAIPALIRRLPQGVHR
jgi:thiamine transporter